MTTYQVTFLKSHRYDEDIPEQQIQRQVEARDPEDAVATVQALEYDADWNASLWSYRLISVREVDQDESE